MSTRQRQDGNGSTGRAVCEDRKDGEVVYESRVRGRAVRLTREGVIEALRGVKPSRISLYAVEIGGTWYSTSQAFEVASGVARPYIQAARALRAFEALGFRLSSRSHRPMGEDAAGRPLLKPGPEFINAIPAEREWLEIGRIVLEWSWWEWWTDIRDGYQGGAQVGVPHAPGVYDVSLYDKGASLYIGRAGDLHKRVKCHLVQPSGVHAAGRRIERNEDVSRIAVRWAVTSRPAAAEEELHRLHVETWGALPKYALRK